MLGVEGEDARIDSRSVLRASPLEALTELSTVNREQNDKGRPYQGGCIALAVCATGCQPQAGHASKSDIAYRSTIPMMQRGFSRSITCNDDLFDFWAL